MSVHHFCKVNCGGTDCDAPKRTTMTYTVDHAPPEPPGESACATCGGLVSDPVIVQPAAQGELTDERIDEIGLDLSDYDDPAYFRVMARAIEREVLAAARKRPEAEVEDWRIEYGCDTGPNDDAIWEWWTVTDGLRSFQFDFKSEAEWLLERLVRGERS